MPKPIATQLSDALGARQQAHGIEVLERFKQNALLPLDPTLANVIFYQGNLEKYNKPKLADGSPNPCWPEDAEIPRDESERDQFYKEIALKQYGEWIKRIEVLTEEAHGFWEKRGYSSTGYPWKNDRYS